MSGASPVSPASLPSAPRLIGEVRGAAPGPTLVLIGGVHGNEPAGIEAAQRTIAAIDERTLRGRVVGLRGHARAAASSGDPRERPRYFDTDLNRRFCPAIGESQRTPGYVEDAEAAELSACLDEICRDASGEVVVLDMHTVSSPSPPFVAVEDALPARRLAMRLRLPIILGIEEELRGLLMDCVTSTRGHIAMVVEGGQHDDPTSIDVLEAAAWTVIETLCMMPAGESPFGAGGPQAVLDRAADALAGRFFDLRHREAIVSPDFIVLEGLRAFSRVRRGKTAIAQCAGRTLVAPISGLLFMPNRQQVRRIGDDGYFIVQPVGRVWLALSAWLRRLRGVHAMLPRLLPGVRRRPGSDELLVSPMIAVVLKRQVFHLLGYRVVRHGTERHLSRGKRAMLAAMGIARATGVIAAGVLRGGERGVLPVETSEDWIVRRRRLDTDPPRRQGSCS